MDLGLGPLMEALDGGDLSMDLCSEEEAAEEETSQPKLLHQKGNEHVIALLLLSVKGGLIGHSPLFP